MVINIKNGFLQMTYFLIITAFTVSIDSFVCGFSLAFSGKKKYLIVAIIALTVLFMCTAANCFAGIFADKLTERTACFGGLILIGIGIYNLFKKEEERPLGEGKIVKQSLLTGFAVGLDGAAANLSLAIMGINAFYVPVIIAAMHALMIGFGIALSGTKLAKKFGRISIIPPLILVCLGLYKLLGLVH